MITKKQEPNNIHSVFENSYYTWNTDLIYSQNFRFKYTLKDINGTFFEGLTVPLEQNLSFNTPSEIIKSKTSFNFNPSITTITNIPNNCIVYQENIAEDINGGDNVSHYVKTGLRYSDPNFNPYDNFCAETDSSDFLVNMPNIHNIRLTDNFTFRTYNGYLNCHNISDAGLVYQYRLELFFKSGNIRSAVLDSQINSYYGSVASQEFNPTVNGDNFNIEMPAGVANWNGNFFKLRTITDNNGIIHNINISLSLNVSNSGYITLSTYNGYLDYYDYYAYRYPHGSGGQISKKHRFNIFDDCKFTSINVAWENKKGGVDYYLFSKANEKTITSVKDIYYQNLHTLNITNASVNKNRYYKGNVVYRNTIETVYELHTDWLNQDEINGLEDLFHSTEVYMNINGTWIYVISVEKNAIIYNKKRTGLKKYKLNFSISENNVRY